MTTADAMHGLDVAVDLSDASGDLVYDDSVMNNQLTPKVFERKVLELAERIKRHRGYIGGSEIRTRVLLIDPVLRELGWDPENPDQVRLEFKGKKGIPDYALMVNGAPVAIIEAKALGKKLKVAQKQIIRYTKDPECSHVSVIVFTNGDEWVFWSESADWDDQTAMITGGNAFETAFYLVECLARPNFRQEVERAASTELPIAGSWHPLSGQLPVRGAPTAIKFDGGTPIDLRGQKWRQVYISIAERMVLVGAINDEAIPVQIDGSYAINHEPTDRDGALFVSTYEMEGGWWLDLSGEEGRRHISRNLTISKSRALMRKFGVDVASVELCFD